MVDELLSQEEINALLDGTLNADNPDNSDNADKLNSEQEGVLQELASAFSSSTSGVVGMLAGRDVSAPISNVDVIVQRKFIDELKTSALRFSAICEGLGDAPLVVIMPEQGVLVLADLMMGGEGKDLPEEPNELFVNAAQEGVSQFVGSALTTVSNMLGGQKLLPGNVAAAMMSGDWLPFPEKDGDSSMWSARLNLEVEGLEPFPVWILFPVNSAIDIADKIGGEQSSTSKTSSVQREEVPPSSAEPRSSASAAESVSSGEQNHTQQQPQSKPVEVRPAEFMPLSQSAGSEHGPGDIGMIEDIPVRVTVELGRTRKNVGEILAMSPGSVIELDKMAGEPVDVLVNGKPIAKGEVVVIDENFGVRVTEILNGSGRVCSMGT